MPPISSNFDQAPQNRRAVNIGRRLETSNPTDPTGLMSTADPQSANASHKIALNREPHLLFGRIVDAVAYIRMYKVQLDRGAGVVLCCDAGHTSMETFGARSLNTYVPGTQVLVLMLPHGFIGTILCAVPDWMISPTDALSDQIVQGSNVGLNIDQAHYAPLGLESAGGLSDFSAGRPTDSIHSGEWGAITDTGLMFFLDPLMATVRVDEETGLFLFHDDALARFAGHQLQLRSAGHDRNDKDDQEEWDQEEYYNAYLWEARGAWNTSTALYRELTAQNVQQDTPWYSRYEPAVDDQQAIHRFRVFRGYLGQAEKKTLFIPPIGATGLEQYSNESQYIGVTEENWGLDGQYSLRSAKGLVLAKRLMIPSPKRLKLAEDVTGDNETNYKANGVYGAGPSHLVGDIPEPMVDPALVRGAAFLDFYAHLFNWKGLHPFYYHTLDWYIPNESGESIAGSMSAGIPDFTSLGSGQYLPTPTPQELFVDTRYGNVRYYPNDSYFALTEDGNMGFGDGYGVEFRTQNGNVILSMPGDFIVEAGRDTYVLAGRNLALRANDCVDLISNKHDVRIKADEKVMIVGGNDQCGGVLIESKSPKVAFDLDSDDETIGGILLRAKETAIVLYGQQIDLILSDDGAGSGTETRSIIMNAGSSGTIIQHGQHVFTRVVDSIQHVFENGMTPVVNEYWVDNALIATPLRVDGIVFVDDCINATGNIATTGYVTGKSFQLVNAAITTTLNSYATDLEVREAVLVVWANDAAPDTTRLQDTTDVLSLQFFYRTSAQCGTVGWLLPETRWQQMARVAGPSVNFWTEEYLEAEVAFPGVHGYPPPGQQAWTLDTGYLQQDLNLFQLGSNLAVDRGSVYETPAYAAPNDVVLDGNLPVIVNPS